MGCLLTKDDMVLEAAVNGRCTRIVTSNRRDIAGSERVGVTPASPLAFLNESEGCHECPESQTAELAPRPRPRTRRAGGHFAQPVRQYGGGGEAGSPPDRGVPGRPGAARVPGGLPEGPGKRAGRPTRARRRARVGIREPGRRELGRGASGRARRARRSGAPQAGRTDGPTLRPVDACSKRPPGSPHASSWSGSSLPLVSGRCSSWSRRWCRPGAQPNRAP